MKIDFELTDDNVLQFLSDKNGNCNRTKLSKLFLENHIELKNYLDNRYEFIENYSEVFHRLKYNIKDHPVCKYCGASVHYVAMFKGKDNYGYLSYCCNKCAKLSPEYLEKHKLTCIEHFGVDHQFKSEKIKEKCKLTLFKHYGVISPLLSDICKQHLIETCLSKYGTINGGASVCAKEKIKITCNTKYGVDSYTQTNEFKLKSILTKLNHFGVGHQMKCNEILLKTYKTNLLKFGYKHPIQNIDIKLKVENTCIKKYGVKSYLLTNKCLLNAHTQEAREKQIRTKIKNGTINTSKVEQLLLQYLLENNIRYEYQYRSELYPFNCDFYFPDFDTYLEILGTWTHGGHPFDPLNESDILILNTWK